MQISLIIKLGKDAYLQEALVLKPLIPNKGTKKKEIGFQAVNNSMCLLPSSLMKTNSELKYLRHDMTGKS